MSTGFSRSQVHTESADLYTGAAPAGPAAEPGAKQGSLSASWVLEYSGVSQAAAASDSGCGPLIAVRTTADAAYAKKESLPNPWMLEHTGASQLADAG